MTPSEAWIVTEFAVNGSLNDFCKKLDENIKNRRTPMYGTRLPKFDDDSGDVLIKIITHIISSILKDVASGIAYIHKKFRFHCFIMADTVSAILVTLRISPGPISASFKDFIMKTN